MKNWTEYRFLLWGYQLRRPAALTLLVVVTVGYLNIVTSNGIQ